MSNVHHPLSDCVIYILVSIIILLSNSVGSNRVYITDDSDTIKGRLRTCSIHSPSYTFCYLFLPWMITKTLEAQFFYSPQQ
jgi:hypothetical protein